MFQAQLSPQALPTTQPHLVGLEDTEEILHTSRIWDPLHSDQGSWL